MAVSFHQLILYTARRIIIIMSLLQEQSPQRTKIFVLCAVAATQRERIYFKTLLIMDFSIHAAV
jgi:hypothetical protein